MSLKKQLSDNLGTLATLAVILSMMFLLFARKSDLDAVAQTVDIIVCKNAKSKLADYEAAVLMSGRDATELMKDAMIELQIIIDMTCPKK
jgi:hypothetical protein